MDKKLTKILRDNDYSLTAPRRAVFDTLASEGALGMRELAEALASNIDRASVYRTVALFEKLGIIVRINQGWKYKIELSDKFAPHHHHMTCQKCGRIVSFDEPEGFEAIIGSLAAEHGFQVSEHSLEISGLCPQCR